VARVQSRFGRKASFLSGLVVALVSALLCAVAVWSHQFGLLVAATLLAGYYSANGQLYRFAAAEIAAPGGRDKAVSWVMAGGLLGAIVGPNLAKYGRNAMEAPFVGAYLALAVVALLSMAAVSAMRFAVPAGPIATPAPSRQLAQIVGQPVFVVAALGSALSYGVMNLLMAATPLAMQVCGLPFDDAALVLQWHVIGMFAPGFFTGHLIQRFGLLKIMATGVVLNLLCIGIALGGIDLHRFLLALFLLGVGWNFLFTASTSLALRAYRPEEKDQAQAAINFGVFATMTVTSFASGALVTTQGWHWLNLGSLLPVAITAAAIAWLAWHQRPAKA